MLSEYIVSLLENNILMLYTQLMWSVSLVPGQLTFWKYKQWMNLNIYFITVLLIL